MTITVNEFLASDDGVRRARARMLPLAEIDYLYANLRAVHKELDPRITPGEYEVTVELAKMRLDVWDAGLILVSELERRGV